MFLLSVTIVLFFQFYSVNEYVMKYQYLNIMINNIGLIFSEITQLLFYNIILKLLMFCYLFIDMKYYM